MQNQKMMLATDSHQDWHQSPFRAWKGMSQNGQFAIAWRHSPFNSSSKNSIINSPRNIR